MRRYQVFFLTLSLLCSFRLTAQEDQEAEENEVIHWNFGINFGVYDANKYPANYYNGSEGNINTVNYVLSNYYWYQDIKLALGASDAVIVDSYPMDMHYNVAMMGGVFLRYNFNKRYGLCVDVNYTQLKTQSAVNFEVDPASYPTLPDIRQIPINGSERRVHFDLLMQRNFWMKSNIYFFVQGGLNFNYARVVKSFIYVVDREYSIINAYGSQVYVPNTGVQEDQVIQGGAGYGGALGGGIGIPLVDHLGVEPGCFINYNNVALIGYPDFKLSYGFYVRFLFGNILPREEESW